MNTGILTVLPANSMIYIIYNHLLEAADAAAPGEVSRISNPGLNTKNITLQCNYKCYF